MLPSSFFWCQFLLLMMIVDIITWVFGCLLVFCDEYYQCLLLTDSQWLLVVIVIGELVGGDCYWWNCVQEELWGGKGSSGLKLSTWVVQLKPMLHRSLKTKTLHHSAIQILLIICAFDHKVIKFDDVSAPVHSTNVALIIANYNPLPLCCSNPTKTFGDVDTLCHVIIVVCQVWVVLVVMMLQ